MNTKRRSWGLGRGSAAREGRTAQRWARGLRQAAQRLVRIGCLLLLALPAAAQDRGIDLHPSPVAQAPAIAGDYWALIIGINHYTKLSPDNQLEAARNDATAIAGVLREHYGFEPKRMTELYDEQASRSAILRNLRALARTLTLKDNLFIYYAGHGLLDKETGLGGWVPSDAEIPPTRSATPRSGNT